MALHTIDIKKEILINKMYVGEYLNNNIGHEVINLLRADGNTDKFGDGQNYIYVQPYGTMEKEHNEKNILKNTMLNIAIDPLLRFLVTIKLI